MTEKIIVTNSEEMCVLLDALNIKRYEWQPNRDKIEINVNPQTLLYLINGSDDAVQHIFGKTAAWRELCGLYVKGMTK